MVAMMVTAKQPMRLKLALRTGQGRAGQGRAGQGRTALYLGLQQPLTLDPPALSNSLLHAHGSTDSMFLCILSCSATAVSRSAAVLLDSLDGPLHGHI